MSEFPVLREHDVYRWSYKDDHGPSAYRCKSRKAIINKGRFIDLYWGLRGGLNCYFSLDEARRTMSLTFLGNLDDYQHIPDLDARYYADADLLWLNGRPNNLYVRKSATPCREKILPHSRELIEMCKKMVKDAQANLMNLQKIIIALELGMPLDEVSL